MPTTRIEAENYRRTRGVGYADASLGNQGSAKNFTDDVDVSALANASGGYYVLGDASGEWLTYDVNITQAGTYRIVPRVATALTGSMSLKAAIAGQTQNIAISNTGGWSAWKDFSSAPISLSAGQQVLRIDITAAGFNFDSFDLVLDSASTTPSPTPASTTATTLIEAENYKRTRGVGYADFSLGNQGSAKNFTDDVDVSALANASGGYYVLSDAAEEWLTYDVTIAQAGQYQIVANTASAATGPMSAKVTIGGQSSTIQIGSTGGWSNWKSFSSSPLTLSAGQQVLRFDVVTAGFNFDWLKIIPFTPPTYSLGTVITATWTNVTYTGTSGTDTIDYSRTGGIKINLATGVVTPTQTLNIMPLGDSITYGLETVDSGTVKIDKGAYRDDLSGLLKANGYSYDFVGPENWGLNGYDNDHAGFPGWTIDQIAKGNGVVHSWFAGALKQPWTQQNPGSVTTWLNTYQPDAVLLMIGTNDILNLSNAEVASAPSRLSSLIDQIVNQSPNAQVLVASIAPTNRTSKFDGHNLSGDVTNFNAQIPGIVNQKKAKGAKVSFVDVNSALTVSDLPDGVHPGVAGNAKIGRKWSDAIANVYNGKVSGIENVIGSAYNDVIVGDSSNNILNGGGGNNTLTGGIGQDIFVLSPQTGSDRITDYTIGQDYIRLSNGLTTSQLSIAQGSGSSINDTFISYAGRTIGTLAGVSASSFLAASPFMPV